MTAQGTEFRQKRESIAIIGMSGRFPGAATVQDLWRVLVEQRETLRRMSPEQLCPSIPERIRSQPDYVPVRGTLDGAFDFDAEYFQITPREAQIMDPQQRLMLEEAVHALEDAGIDPHRYAGDIGVYCGKGTSEYLTHNVLAHPDMVETYGEFPTEIATEKDFVATRIAYELDLRGPAVSVNTACSTSLLAVNLAVDSLRLGHCDAAIAGGVCIHSPQDRGYLSGDGGHASRDGHVRPFDSKASGTVFSSGVALVVLKRLDDALRDRDPIRAVILGTGTNNNGAAPRSFMGPSVDGQAEAVRRALRDAGIPARGIDLMEAHGTATLEGDPVEFAALEKAFRDSTDDKAFCALGSLKGNLGHLDAAGGAAGLIKIVQCLEHELVAPMIHFEEPNPAIELESSPFFIAEKALPWPRSSNPRRAGVSAFGIGGTNAHVVVQEAPATDPSGPSRPVQLLVHSARSGAALDRVTRQLAGWLGDRAEGLPSNELADVAYTLQVGRTAHTHRRFAMGESARELARALHDGSPDRVVTGTAPPTPPQVAFVFPGQGAQYVNMGSGLYSVEPLFRGFIDECAELLKPHLDLDIREVLLPAEVTARHLRQTRLTQPAVFVVEYSLARLWQAWGVEPDVLVGHSVGQYVAACLAGVMSLSDALAVVARRGSLMQDLPPGLMLSVRLPEAELTPLLGEHLSLAAVNAPELCVASGPEDAIEGLARTLKERDVPCRRLDTSHAFHSSMMEPMIGPFTEFISGIQLSPPRLPLLCTTTGEPMSAEDACNPSYWACHVRDAVRFGEAVHTLWKDESRVVLEVGPGRMMATLARQQLRKPATQAVVSSLLETPDAHSECRALLHAVGQLWLRGVDIDWTALEGDERRRKVSLPGYPFEATRHWLSPRIPEGEQARAATQAASADATACAVDTTPAISPSSSSLASMNAAPTAAPAGALAKAAGRVTAPRDEVAARLQASLQEASGLSMDAAPSNMSFLELGLDSLFLTQWARSLRETFGVRVTVRQLLDTHQTFEALVDLIAASAPSLTPAGAVTGAVTGAAAAPAPRAATLSPGRSSPAPGSGSAGGPAPAPGAFASADVEHLARRLDEMSRQIASLSQAGGSAPSVGERARSTPSVAPPGASKDNPTPAAPAQGTLDPTRPPLPGARLGRAADGCPAWFIPDPARPGRYLQVELESESDG